MKFKCIFFRIKIISIIIILNLQFLNPLSLFSTFFFCLLLVYFVLYLLHCTFILTCYLYCLKFHFGARERCSGLKLSQSFIYELCYALNVITLLVKFVINHINYVSFNCRRNLKKKSTSYLKKEKKKLRNPSTPPPYLLK